MAQAIEIIAPDGKQRVEVVDGAVLIERRAGEKWQSLAQLPQKDAWTIYSDWKDGWPSRPTSIGVHDVRAIDVGTLEMSADADVQGSRWRLYDRISFAHDLVKIERTFEHLGDQPQSKITLATRVRVPIGSDPRLLIPGNNYNNNPSLLQNLPGPKLAGYRAGARATYEEHRLPIPMVSVESTVEGDRRAAAIITVPSRVGHGNKGDDQWWSAGVEWGDGYVDLLSMSGPVATNGKDGQIYGHRNGFDPYDEAWLNVPGKATFTKTFYVDTAGGARAGWAFAPTLSKAFDVFRPTQTPHVDFAEAVRLKKAFAKDTFFQNDRGAAGWCFFPGNGHLEYAWCGSNLAIAYALLYDAGVTNDAAGREMALKAVNFWADHVKEAMPGLYYGDYFAKDDVWRLAAFWGEAAGVSSRQFGENLDQLADLVELARAQNLASDKWLERLRKGCDFLLAADRFEGLLPRAWTPDGKALGWKDPANVPERYLSTAGVYCVSPLVKLSKLTGDAKYKDAAVKLVDAYWRRYGDLKTPFWGGTIDAGGEDKEAGFPFIFAATDLYEATGDERYLSIARDAADWTATWMYFHDVGFPAKSTLRDRIHTIGWTFISLQNQEIDVFGYWMGPAYYKLGMLAHDDRYKQLGRVMFEAATQTVARPGDMFDQKSLGLQFEHYNHTNCTYIAEGPWRSGMHSPGIAWSTASGLFAAARLAQLDPAQFSIAGK